jgi:high affinity sulfate transporter 1
VAPGLVALAQYRVSWLPKDLAAGLSVAAIALPVGIAYADLAGVSPVVGMYSAIFPLFVYALFGSSRQLMTGPDAATCIIVAASLGPLAGGDPVRYTMLLELLTVMTGLLYLIAGGLRLGFIANFLSQPILVGYLNGIALLIIVGQLPKLFGYAAHEKEFFAQILEFVERVTQGHPATMMLGGAMLALLVAIMRFLPRLPGALVVVVVSIGLVSWLGLDAKGVAVLGQVPAGLPSLTWPGFDFSVAQEIMTDAAGIMLVSFTSGVLTSKSFGRRNGYDVDANQELIGFGASNVVTGFLQGFPVTGADSRTAVNSAMGGKTQMVGIVAGATMLMVLLFLTSPLAYVPIAALAAVILVSAAGLFDFRALQLLLQMSRREFLMSVSTTVGVLVLGVLPGVLLAVALSLLWLLTATSRPNDAVLGKVQGRKGFYDVAEFPDAKTIPGLLMYRFESNIVFYNADWFKQRVHEAIAAQETPVEWVVIDASPVNVIDATALYKIDELRDELAAKGISMYLARVEPHLGRFFNPRYVREREKTGRKRTFQTLNPAIRAYLKYQKAKGRAVPDPDVVDPESVSQVWKDPVKMPRKKQDKAKALPLPGDEAGFQPADRPTHKH